MAQTFYGPNYLSGVVPAVEEMEPLVRKSLGTHTHPVNLRWQDKVWAAHIVRVTFYGHFGPIGYRVHLIYVYKEFVQIGS